MGYQRQKFERRKDKPYGKDKKLTKTRKEGFDYRRELTESTLEKKES